MNDQSMTRVRVDLKKRAYDILIAHKLLEGAGVRLKEMFPGARFGIISDDQVEKFQLLRLTKALDKAGLEYTTICVPHGESTKNYGQLTNVVDAILAARLERGDIILALGGGVVGDLAGFAAAIARRGMAFVQMPTTLLAQVDSSVGGKTGINSKYGKNLVGAFHQPSLVLADLDVFATLPERQFASGYAEMVKYGLLGDEEFFFWLEKNLAEIQKWRPGPREGHCPLLRRKSRHCHCR